MSLSLQKVKAIKRRKTTTDFNRFFPGDFNPEFWVKLPFLVKDLFPDHNFLSLSVLALNHFEKINSR
jgi:hypothetical protein